MKSKIIAVGGALIAMNLLIGLLLSFYGAFNLWFSTLVLLLGTALVYGVNSIRINDAAKVSLIMLFTISCFVKFILGLIAPKQLQNNWCLVACIVITAFEVLILVVYHKKQV